MIEEKTHEVSINKVRRRWGLIVRILASVIMFGIIGAVIYAAVVDVCARVRARQEQILLEVDHCRTAYKEAECDPPTRRQALEDFCLNTEKCLSRNPFEEASHLIPILTLLGESFNSFFESMSTKTILCLFGFVFVPLFAFLYLRGDNRAREDDKL